MSIDASRFGDICSYIHVLWSGMYESARWLPRRDLCLLGPFQIVLALTLLYRQMQLAIVPGVVLLLLLIPLNLFIQRIQKKLTVGRRTSDKLGERRAALRNDLSRLNKCNWKINVSKWWMKFSTVSKYWNYMPGKLHLCVDWTMCERRNYSAFERKQW